MGRRSNWVPWTLLAVLMCLVAGGAALSVTTTDAVPGPTNSGSSGIPIPSTPFTGFGGYFWYGATTSISAQWAVPTIVSNKPGVSASTWVGAQSSSGNAFVQIGTTEEKFSSAPPAYEAFWSDTALHFEAQPIRPVGASDQITASMTQLSTGWVLHIADLTENWSRNIRTVYADHTPFNQGQWLQEDPPPSLNSVQDLPYPVTSLVRFTNVEIDGRVPTLTYSNGQALSGFGGVFLVPTAFTDDSFALPPALGAARQYLSDAAHFDAGLYRIDHALAATHTALSDEQRRQAAAQLVVNFSGFNADVLRQTWPPSAGADIQQLVGAVKMISNDYRAVAKVGFKDTPAVSRKVLLDFERFHSDVEATRALLGLPPT